MRTRHTLARSVLVSVVLALGGAAPAMAAEGRITWTATDAVVLTILGLPMLWKRLMRKETKPEPAKEEPRFVRQSANIRSYPDGYDVSELGTFPR